MLVLGTIGASFALRLLIVLRGYHAGILRTYVWFYAYIISGAIFEGILAVLWSRYPAQYATFYWPFQFVTLAIGCGLVVEIFKHVLGPYPGAEKFARFVCLTTFGVILAVGLIYPYVKASEVPISYQIALERDVRTTQIFFFVVILAVIFRYAIPLGRNMRGMIYGYGVYLGASLVTLTLRAYVGSDFNTIWRVLQPFSFGLSLFIWLVAFWLYAPNPVPAKAIPLEEDYEALAALTKARVDALRSYVGRSVRQ